ncbi:MAG: SUMF1/EgtB/PvdO family nonheme iron enzyme [Chloroflexi bacterium]|uniref:formylglycine-generating enzyme family protein n=1 Tax=Candidatus Flexifilum breve TaxID=3140694 RepID=UPI00313769D0|nr:SUMF1/EgtB/PvdO family nonheme iron enzyme [Chloroflexota bacterium]
MLKPGLRATRAIIERPATLSQIAIEPELVELILADMKDEPGSLPLAAYVLRELFEQSKQTGTLTRAAYLSMNGIKGAISAQADKQFVLLSPEAKATLPFVFRRLVTLNERNEPIARHGVPTTAFGTNAAAQQLLEGLDRAHLLVYSRDGSNQPVVELAHEAILSSWDELQPWLKSDGEFLRWKTDFDADVRAWVTHNRDRSYHYTGLRLAVAERWFKDYAADFDSPDAKTFMARSRQQRQLIRLLWRFVYTATLLIVSALSFQTLYQRSLIVDAAGEVVTFPASTARLGAEEQPIQLNAFGIERFEVTNRQYNICVEAGICLPPLYPSTTMAEEKADDLPVSWVTLSQAIQYCNWIGRRIPTADEWERAARGTDARLFPWGGEEPGEDHRINWTLSDFPELFAFHAVPANDPDYTSGATPDGIFHMLGNVQEWTNTPSDCELGCQREWDGTSPVLFVGQGWANGMWISGATLSPLAQRTPAEPNLALLDLGFRCAE